jgi:hypothetical protein
VTKLASALLHKWQAQFDAALFSQLDYNAEAAAAAPEGDPAEFQLVAPPPPPPPPPPEAPPQPTRVQPPRRDRAARAKVGLQTCSQKVLVRRLSADLQVSALAPATPELATSSNVPLLSCCVPPAWQEVEEFLGSDFEGISDSDSDAAADEDDDWQPGKRRKAAAKQQTLKY